jgi:hypothetical protein
VGKNKANILVVELLKSIDSVGLDITIQTLQNAQNFTDDTIILQDYIINTTCSHFSFKVSNLYLGKNNTEKSMILGLIAYLLFTNLDFSQIKIANILKKDNSVISKHIKKLSTLDNKHIVDLEMIKNIKILNLQIKEFKNKIKNNG